MTAPPIDLDDPALLLRDDVILDPTPLYDRLRRDAPVWQIPGQHSYLVSDPDLLRDVVARPGEFSSNLVSLLHRGDDDTLVPFELMPPGDPSHVLAIADPPAHTAHRKLLQPHLNPRSVAELEPNLRALVDERLAPVLGAGGGDIVASLANPVPALVICRLIGMPAEDASRLVPLVLETGALLDGVTDRDGMERAGLAALEMMRIGADRLADARSRAPDSRDGLLAVLVDGIDDGVVTADQARDILLTLFNAGTETTSSLIATAVETLARRPDLQARLRLEPERIPDAVERILSDDGPFQFHYRWTTADTSVGGVAIPAGSRVLLMWAAANRPDPPDPRDRHDPGSGGEDADAAMSHWAFGRGLHFCIGAPLARLEGRVVLEQLLAATTAITLDPHQPPHRRPSIFLRRHDRLPVRLETR